MCGPTDLCEVLEAQHVLGGSAPSNSPCLQLGHESVEPACADPAGAKSSARGVKYKTLQGTDVACTNDNARTPPPTAPMLPHFFLHTHLWQAHQDLPALHTGSVQNLQLSLYWSSTPAGLPLS